MLVIHQECSQSSQNILEHHQDGGYYSRKDYGWFLIGLLIFNFSSNLRGLAGHGIIFSFWNIVELESYPSRKL